MAGALGSALGAFRPSSRVYATVFLERNPYLSWETQRPVFQHPVWSGVVHPHLPHWGTSESAGTENLCDEDSATTATRRASGKQASTRRAGVSSSTRPSEPTSESRSWLPRVARLSPTEAQTLPPFHVQTISGSLCRDANDAQHLIRAASDAGASTLLCVTGDTTKTNGKSERIDSLTLLRFAREMKRSGDVDDEINIACVANPCLETAMGNGIGAISLERKIQAGAEMVITQPEVVPELGRRWREEISNELGLFRVDGSETEIEMISGISVATSEATSKRWMTLVFGDGWDARFEGTEAGSLIQAVLRELSVAENTLDKETFKNWVVERSELHCAGALLSPTNSYHGLHVMPVTVAGYESAGVLADSIATLVEVRDTGR